MFFTHPTPGSSPVLMRGGVRSLCFTHHASRITHRHDLCPSLSAASAPVAAAGRVAEGQARPAARVCVFLGPTGPRRTERLAVASGGTAVVVALAGARAVHHRAGATAVQD